MRRRSIPQQFASLKHQSKTAPALAGDLAYRLFCTPSYSKHRAADHDILATRARYYLRNADQITVATKNVGTIQAYVMHPDSQSAKRTALMMHGWTSEASFMAGLAEPLRRRGFKIILFDCPAHGRSEGRHASLIDCTHAMIEITNALGPIDDVVAHSLGCLACLLAAVPGPPFSKVVHFGRYVLISAPHQFSKMTGEFACDLGLTRRAQRVYEHHLERIAHRPLTSCNTGDYLAITNKPALLIHDQQDTEVPISNAEQIAALCPLSHLSVFDGFGHRRILSAPPVIRAALNFLEQPTTANPKSTPNA